MTQDLDRYASIRERDIDLLLCVAAPTLPTVWRLFRDHPEAPTSHHSVSTETGEIDVVLRWPDCQVHVENKIGAGFQPNQPDRYAVRAEETPATTAVLLAPTAYLEANNLEARKFHHAIAYEELADALRSSGSDMGSEMALIVRHAIEQHRRGPVHIVSDLRTAFFTEFAVQAQQKGIPFQNIGGRGPKSGFFYIHGWDEVASHKVELAAKFEHHRAVDIQISAAAHLEESVAELCRPADLSVRSTPNGTLIISAEAGYLEPDRPLDQQRDQLDVHMKAAIKITSWWKSSGRESIRSRLIGAD